MISWSVQMGQNHANESIVATSTDPTEVSADGKVFFDRPYRPPQPATKGR